MVDAGLPGAPFVGLANYRDLLQDAPFWHAMQNTAIYTVLSVPLGMAVSLAMAVVVNRRLPGINVFRAIFFLPVITSWVAVSVVWITLLSPNAGVVNYAFDLVCTCRRRPGSTTRTGPCSRSSSSPSGRAPDSAW